MRLLVFFSLFFSSLLFGASYEGEIFTWGYGELIKNILEAIRALVDNNGLGAVFKAAVGIAFLAFAFKKATDGRSNIAWEFGKFMVLATTVWYLFLNAPNDAKHRYIITDRTTGAQYVVEQVPTGIGEPLSLISNLEDKIAAAMEREFSLPNSITYRNSGFGFPLQAQSIMPELKTADIYFTLTLKDFLENCTLYEIQDGTKDVKTLLSANDLLAALDPEGDTRLTKVYSAASPDGEVMQCKDAYPKIVDYVKNNQVPKIEKLAAAMLSTTTTVLENRLPDVAQLFFNASESARNYLQQNFVINMVKGSFASIAAATGLSESQLAYSAAIAKQSTNDRFITMGYLAKDYLPIAKGVLTALIVGLSWIIALLAIIFMDFRYLTKYFFLLLWLMLWTPIIVIINYIGDMYVAKVFHQVVNDTGQTITLYTSSFFNNKISSTLAWLGYLVWVTPPLAYAIAKASEYGFVSIASSLSGMAAGGAGAGASADVSNAQNPAPKMRVGNTTYTDMPGGGIQKEQQFSYGGHSVDERAVNMGSSTRYDFGVDNIGKLTANVAGGNINGVNFSAGGAASANLSRAIKSDLSQKLSQKEQELKAYAASYSEAVSGSINRSISQGGTFSIDTTKATSTQTREAVSKDVTTTLSEMAKHSHQVQNFLEQLNQARGSLGGQLGIKVNEDGVKGEIQLSFVDSKSEKHTLTLTGEEAKQFMQKFNKSFSKDMAQSEAIRNDFKLATSFSDGKTYSQIASMNEKYDEKVSEVKELEKAYALVSSKGLAVSQNAFNLLAKDLISEYEAKNPNLSKEEILKAVSVDMTEMIENGKIYDEMKKRGIVDRFVSQITREGEAYSGKPEEFRQNVNSALNKGANIKAKSYDGVRHTSDEVSQNRAKIKNTIVSNETTKSALEEKFKNTDIGYKDYSNDIKTEAKDISGRVNGQLDKSLMSIEIDRIKSAAKGVVDTAASAASAVSNFELSVGQYIADKTGFTGNSGIIGQKEYHDKQNHYFGGENEVPKALMGNAYYYNKEEYQNLLNAPHQMKGNATWHNPTIEKETQISDKVHLSDQIQNSNPNDFFKRAAPYNSVYRTSFYRYEGVIGDQRELIYQNNVKNGIVRNDLLRKPSDFIPGGN